MSELEKTIKINEDLTLVQRVNGLTFGTDAYLLAAMAKGGRRPTSLPTLHYALFLLIQ